MLRTAPPHIKAEMIARMVQAYLPGREGIETLDAVLAGQAPPAHAAPQPMRDPRVDEIIAKQRQEADQRRQASIQRAKAALAEVEGEEFFEDVREDMAEVIARSRARGVDISLKDAYHRACRLHPEVSKVLEQRERANQADGSTPRKLDAASSPRSTAAMTPGSGEESLEIRDLLKKQMGVP
jgi:hypothetical protein